MLGLLLIAATAPACERDHDALAKGPPTPQGGAAGSAGRSSGGSQAGFTTIPQTGGASTMGTGGRRPDEAPGETVLTFVHGIVDADRVLVCFLAGRGADARVLDGPVAELAYGESVVLPSLPGASLVTDDIEPLVIAGELELVSELGCEEALAIARAEQDAAPTAPPDGAGGAGGTGASAGGAGGSASGAGGTGANVGADAGGGSSSDEPPSGDGTSSAGGAGGSAPEGGAGGEGGASSPLPPPPRLRVGELPLVPAGTMNGGRSYLLVGNGCIGGPAFAGKYAKEACGDHYALGTPSLSAMLVAMSRRTEFGKLGLQVAHASVATGVVDLTALQLIGGEQQPIVNDVELGSIVPGASQLAVTAEGYGANSPLWEVEVQDNGTPLFRESWATIKKRAGLASLDDGRSYTLVVLGPNASLTRKGFWNPRAIAVVRSDPTRPE